MADLIFPPSLLPTRVTWTLQRNVATYTSPLSYASQRNDQNRSARWRATIEMPPLAPDDAAQLSTWLDQISRGEHVGLVPVHQNSISGTESAGLQSLTGLMSSAAEVAVWQSTYNQGLAYLPYAQSGDLVIYAANTTNNFATRPVNVTVGLPYLVTIDAPPQVSPGSASVFSAALATSLFTTPALVGRATVQLTPTTTQLVPVLSPTNGAMPFSQSRYSNVKLNRCMLAEQASAAGSNTLIAYCGFSSLPQLLFKRGQFVELQTSRGWQLVRLEHDVDLIPGGVYGSVNVGHVGRMTFEPALRGSVAVNAAIQHVMPVCRMRLATPESTAVIDAPNFSGFTFDLVEDIAP